MKLRVELDGETCILDFEQNGASSDYRLNGVVDVSGTASIAQLTPGAFSILLGNRSFAVFVAEKGDELEIWSGNQHHTVAIADARDRVGTGKKVSAAGPMELRAQMPGKVIKLLAKSGDPVTTGQGIIVVEAMKMQNEMKSPKDGVVSKVLVTEGATIAAGETLVVVE